MEKKMETTGIIGHSIGYMGIIPKAIFYLLKGDYTPQRLQPVPAQPRTRKIMTSIPVAN